MNTIKLLKKDKRARKGIFRFDVKKRLYTFINNTCGKPGQILSRKIKEEEELSAFDAYSVLKLANVKYSLFGRQLFSRRLYTRPFICKHSGRPRGLISKFFLSRMVFKRLTTQGCLPGVKRASW